MSQVPELQAKAMQGETVLAPEMAQEAAEAVQQDPAATLRLRAVVMLALVAQERPHRLPAHQSLAPEVVEAEHTVPAARSALAELAVVVLAAPEPDLVTEFQEQQTRAVAEAAAVVVLE